jgi:hypothetical protein
VLLHVHGRSDSSTIWSGGLSLTVWVIVGVENLMNLLASNDWVIKCVGFVVSGNLEFFDVLVCACGEKAWMSVPLRLIVHIVQLE